MADYYRTVYTNTRVNAGISRSIERVPCTIWKDCPFYIRTNVDTVESKLKKEH